MLSAGPKPFQRHSDKNYMHFDVEDFETESIYKHLAPSVAFIKEALTSGGAILVYCQAGMSRSASCVIAYFISEHNLSYFEAMQLVKAKRPIVCVNLTFAKELMKFEEDCRNGVVKIEYKSKPVVD